MTKNKGFLLNQRKEIISGIMNELYRYDQVVAILIIGSTVWGMDRGLTKISDIDIDIILKGPLPMLINDSYEFFSFRSSYNKLIRQGNIDYGSWKYTQDNVMVGLHFVPEECFNTVCSLDYKNQHKTSCLREYRIKPKHKDPIYIQRNSFGEKYIFECKQLYINEGIITLTPLVIIDDGIYFNGLLPDKYLSYPIIYSKKHSIYSSIYNLKRRLYTRIQSEKHIDRSDSIKLSNLLHARDRMVPCRLNNLDLESSMLNLIDENMLYC